MSFHPREDFVWDSTVHGFKENMIETEDRICWKGYQKLLERLNNNLDKTSNSSLPYVGSRIVVVDLQGIGQICGTGEGHGHRDRVEDH